MLNSLPACCYGVPEKSADFWGVLGNRNGSNVNNVQNNGNYWSATENKAATREHQSGNRVVSKDTAGGIVAHE